MVPRKFLGQTTQKVVCLADIYRIPAAVRPLQAKDIDAANGVECDISEFKVLEFVSHSAITGPNKTRNGVD
jgi:hypothetical protein